MNKRILLLVGILLPAWLFGNGVCQGQIDPQESPEGFFSINCGGTTLKDPDTGLDWVSDEAFLGSAKQLLNEEGVAVSAIVQYDDSEATASSLLNLQQSRTAMAFVPGRTSRSKYCYNMYVNYTEYSNSTNYLLRATFPNSNLTDANNQVPLDVYSTRFYFTVDSTFVKTIDLDPVEAQTVELVVTPLDNTIHVCLVPLEDRSSMPAISSLELRKLGPWLYDRTTRGQSNTASETRLQTSYFITVARLDFGPPPESPPIRYPDDAFDRIWYPARIPDDKLTEIRTRKRKARGRTVEGLGDIYTPERVMHTAWEGVTNSSVIPVTLNITKAQADHPVPTFYVNMMLLDVNPGSNKDDIRLVDIYLTPDPEYVGYENVIWATQALVDSSIVMPQYNYKQVFVPGFSTFSLEANSESTLPAMINAMEVYGEFDAVTERTAQLDATQIQRFAKRFAERLDTAGDPCLPVSWDWLVCSIEIPPRITQINLMNQGVTGELDAEFGNLNRLTVLDLSNNSFYGSLPSSLVDVVTLRSLNLAHNNLSGEVPPFLEKTFVNLETVSLRNNKLSGSLLSLVKALAAPVSSLDLSNNKFSGSIPVEIGELTNLKTLDLSNNRLSGPLHSELFQLPGLRSLNLRNNLLDGMGPDEIWSSNTNLVHLDLQGNRFTELNLTTWSQNVLRRTSSNALQFQQQVSLLDNGITNVILPAQEVLQRFEQNFERVYKKSPEQVPTPAGFILLGGSPWCRGVEANASAALIPRFLCRFKEGEEFYPPRSVDKNGVSTKMLVVIGVTSGLLILLMACILSFFLWRMWKRMNELRQIQEALAKDDVRPPFFKYEELRTATRDFARQNELGRGAFGAVYKVLAWYSGCLELLVKVGLAFRSVKSAASTQPSAWVSQERSPEAVLGDGSIVAVKRLFPTQQNVADFLKEMVLITGIKHRHLVQLKGCCVRDKQRMLVYEYAENKNLAEALWGKYKPYVLTWAQRFNICVGIARGLAYLHEELQPKIIHRDVKPENILLDRDLNPKIADFGLARPVLIDNDGTQISSHVGGTLGYFSPEYATLGRFTEKLDVYSYGVLVLEIVSGRRCIDFSLPEEEVYVRNWAFKLLEEDKLLNMAEEGLLFSRGSISSGDEILSVLKMALACLQEDPNKRPSMSQVVNMLVGNSDLAVDIVKELKHNTSQPLQFDQLFFEQSILMSTDDNRQQETHVRVSLSALDSSNSQQLMGLNWMKPR